MLIHSVFFWLKPETTPAQRAALRKGLESLGNIKLVEAVYVGTPAGTPARPVIDRSYDLAITMIFKDVAAHDAYQVSAQHEAFVRDCESLWSRVQVYDAS